MAHYISKREMQMLERDRRENCGDEGYRYIERRDGDDGVVSERQRRNVDREKRKEKKKRERERSLHDSIEAQMSETGREQMNEQERIAREIQQQQDQLRLQQEELRNQYLEELRREKEEKQRQKEYDSRSLEEMVAGHEKHTPKKLNYTYHGPEKERSMNLTQKETTYHGPEKETSMKSTPKENTRHKPGKETHEKEKYTYHNADTHHGFEDETTERKLAHTEDERLVKKMNIKREVQKLEEKVARTDIKKDRNKEGEKFMSWIDEKYDALSHHGSYEKRDDKDNESSEEYEETEEEDSEDEMIRLQKGIELLKSKEVSLKGQVRDKELEKKQREEDEKRAIEEEKRRKKMLEKQERMRRLKEEQMRLLNSIRQSQNRLQTLENSDDDQDEHIYHRSESKHRKTEYRETESRDHYRKRYEETPEIDSRIRYAQSKLPDPKLPRLKEESFEEWKVEVEVMMNSNLYPKDSLLHCVRNSVSNSTGNIRKVLPTIPINATTEEILEKLDNIYGDRRSGESHLAEFYKSKQTSDENVAEWGVRLEIILQKAWKKGQITQEQMDQMLRRRFWKYLYNEKLKLNTRIFYENCRSFEELRKEVRIEENEMNSDSDSSGHRVKTPEKSTNKKEPKVGQLLDRLRRLEEQSSKQRYDRDKQQRSDRDEQFQNVVKRLEQLEEEQERNNERTKRKEESEVESHETDYPYTDIRTDYTDSYERNGRGRSRYRRPWRSWRYDRDDSRYRRGDGQNRSWYRRRGYRFDRYDDGYRRSEGSWRNNYGEYSRDHRENERVRDERTEWKDDNRDRQERNQNRNDNYTYQSKDHRDQSKEESYRGRHDENRQTYYPRRNQQEKHSDRKGDNLNK